MKILGISGGNKNGANDCMCKEALLAAKEQGAEIEFVRLMDLDIKHCTGCKACVMSLFSGRGNMCVLKDDFQWLLDKMLDADGIIFSIPIFWTTYGLIQQHCCGQDFSSKRRQTDRSKIYENKSCFLHGNRWF